MANSTSSSSTTSTSTPTAAEQIMLGPDGLSGTLKFGLDGDEAVDIVSAELGVPSHDQLEEFVPLDSPVGDNKYGDAADELGALSEYPFYRVTCWETLCLEMDSADGSAWTFAAWRYASEINLAGYTSDLSDSSGRFSTSDDVTLGTTWGEVRANHPDVTVDWGEGGAVGFTLPGWEPSSIGAVAGTGVLDFNANFITGFDYDELLAEDIPDDVVVIALFAGEGLDYGCC